MTSKNRHLSIPKRFWNKKKKGLHPFRHSHRFRRPADPNQGTPIKCQTHARKRLDSPSTSNSWNACLWWANATTDLSKKFCKQSSGKDFPIDKRSLNHRSVIALFLHHSSTNRRSAEEESVASGNDYSLFLLVQEPLPRVLSRDNRSYRSFNVERATLERNADLDARNYFRWTRWCMECERNFRRDFFPYNSLLPSDY